MKRNSFFVFLIMAAASSWGFAKPPAYLSFTPTRHAFTCDVPSSWPPFEEETPRGSAVHFLGPAEADGAYRAAIHIRFIQKGHPAYIPIQTAIKMERKSEKTAGRSATEVSPWHISRNRAERFEVTETRQLPDGFLPSRPVLLHHYVAIVEANDGYFIIKLSSTRDTYLDYRNDFDHLLKTFVITGNF